MLDRLLAILRAPRAPSRVRPTGRRARAAAKEAREEPLGALTPADSVIFPPRGLAPPRLKLSVKKNIKAPKSPLIKLVISARRKLPEESGRLLLMAVGLLPPARSQAVRLGLMNAPLAVLRLAVQRRAARHLRYRRSRTQGLK